jgi:hypothetical protein
VEGVAYASWWMPVMLGVAHDDGDVDDGKPHRDLSHGPTEPTPVVSPSRAPPSSESFDLACPLPFIAIGREMIAWWASSALLCAIVFLLSVHAFNGKVSTYLFFAQRALLSPCTPLIHSLHLPPLPHPPTLFDSRARRRRRGPKC